jgi:hypothetical protein
MICNCSPFHSSDDGSDPHGMTSRHPMSGEARTISVVVFPGARCALASRFYKSSPFNSSDDGSDPHGMTSRHPMSGEARTISVVVFPGARCAIASRFYKFSLFNSSDDGKSSDEDSFSYQTSLSYNRGAFLQLLKYLFLPDKQLHIRQSWSSHRNLLFPSDPPLR